MKKNQIKTKGGKLNSKPPKQISIRRQQGR